MADPCLQFPFSTPGESAPAGVLPHAMVLSYFNAGTPTRVRIVAARCLIPVGVAYLLLCGLTVYGIIDDVLQAHRPFHVMNASELWNLAASAFEENPAPLVGLGLFLIGGMVLLCVRGVRRGKKFPSILASAALLPLGIGVFAATIGLWAIAVMEGFGLFHGIADRWYLLLLIPGILGVLLVLLLKDLADYLLWIARNPATEKHPIAFVSGKEIT